MKLRSVAAERDFIVGEMKEMAEQCQSVAEEFQSMADYSEKLVQEISMVRIYYLATYTMALGYHVFIWNNGKAMQAGYIQY